MTQENATKNLTPIQFPSNRFRIIANLDNGERYKLFQIQFQTGANFYIFVQPYTNSTEGLLSLVRHRKGTSEASLIEHGYTTSSLAKYSHPFDGNAHFSQNVFSKIRNQANRLDMLQGGQLFIVTINGLTGFQNAAPGMNTTIQPETMSKTKIKKLPHDIDLYFKCSDIKGKVLKFTGWWFHISQVKIDKDTGPKLNISINGEALQAIAICPFTEDSYFKDCVLLLAFELLDIPEEPPHFTLMGGFTQDLRPAILNFLTMVYPRASDDEIGKHLEPIDYKPDKTPPEITLN